MKFGLLLGIVCAVVLHVGFLLFGGLIVGHEEKGHGTLAVVELMSEEETAAEEKKPEEQAAEQRESDAENLQAEADEAPDSAELIRNIEQSAAASMPELEAASLSAIEAALSGQSSSGSSDFAQALDFASGGRIGGTGKAGVVAEAVESAFSLTEIDQQPRVIYQAAATFPSSMRGKKIEGVVSVLFVVDANGKVENPRVDKSNGAAFEKPALDAVKNWKFEPAIKAGQRVSCKMRVSVRFPPS